MLNTTRKYCTTQIKSCLGNSGRRFFHDGSTTRHYSEYSIHEDFTIGSERQNLGPVTGNSLKVRKWYIPNERSVLRANQKILELQVSNRIYEMVSKVEGLIIPNPSLVENNGETLFSMQDTLFNLVGNDLILSEHLYIPPSNGFGIISEYKVKEGDWVEKGQVGALVRNQNNQSMEWILSSSGQILKILQPVGKHIQRFEKIFEMMIQRPSYQSKMNYQFMGLEFENPKFNPNNTNPQMYYFQEHVNEYSIEVTHDIEIFHIEWNVSEGKIVKKGDLLCSYEIPKLRIEFMCPYDGQICWLQKEKDILGLGDLFFSIIIHND